MFGLVGGEVVEVDEVEPVGPVRVADEGPRAVGDEHLVMPSREAHGGQVRRIVAATPAAGTEMMDLQPVTDLAARDATMPVAQQDRSRHLR